MIVYAVKRILSAIPVLLLLLLLVLLLVDLVPGDPAARLAGPDATPDVVDRIRQELNLDQPIWTRYVDYLANAVQGNLGNSFTGTRVPVAQKIAEAIPATAALTVAAIIIALIIAVPLGIFAARHQGKAIDRVVTLVSSVGVTIPTFIVGLVLVLALSIALPIFPAVGYVPLSAGVGPWLVHLLLPALTLALVPCAELMRQVRGSFIDVGGHDYIRAARARGLSETSIVGKHMVKNAAIPVVTVLGLQAGRLIGGAVVVELVFAIGGFGSLLYGAVINGDVLLLQGAVLVTALFVLAINLVVDLSYAYFNPALRT
jgi:peptide/nickel transport system permease protein